ncbi:MAG: hypothetical protein JNK26_04685 [Candidatus Doudnabacteria bacterium]|nr:hypothetical protein [Candidatus Doudnabacteria bacterium]
MNVDDFVKILLAVSVAFAIVGIAFQIMRLIGKTADSVQDFRKTIQNVSSASDLMLEDYKKVRGLLTDVLDIISTFRQNILTPAKALLGFVKIPKKEPQGD